jgi:homoserine kinase
MKTVKIRVPASTANLGPGYDTLGIGLTIGNTFEISLHDTETTVECLNGNADKRLADLCLAMIRAAAARVFAETHIPPVPLHIRFDNQVPIARGLASSATIRLAVQAALNQLLALNLGDKQIVQWVSELEGSTDNAAASYFGGLTASGIINGRLVYHKIDIPEEIDFVAVSPVCPVETDQARKVFTEDIGRKDAVFTLNRGILLTIAFANKAYDDMGDLFDDKIHQPDRQAHIPALEPLFDVIQAARQAGALGAFLSGSGSTMMALTLHHKEAVAAAMQRAIANYGMESEARFLKADNHGIRITALD